jgi:hypothetical protein
MLGKIMSNEVRLGQDRSGKFILVQVRLCSVWFLQVRSG